MIFSGVEIVKLNQLVLMGVTSFLASAAVSVSGYAAGVPANPSSNANAVNSSIPTGSNAVVAQNQTTAIMSGTFVAAEKPTTGVARIVRQNGHSYLELDSAFSASDQGPDLHVLLSPSEKPPQTYSSQQSGSYVNLGKLQKFKGAQRYPIPDSIKLENFKSVSIWCRMANATFGYAPLRPASTASN
jgi:hypothetical protein